MSTFLVECESLRIKKLSGTYTVRAGLNKPHLREIRSLHPSWQIWKVIPGSNIMLPWLRTILCFSRSKHNFDPCQPCFWTCTAAIRPAKQNRSNLLGPNPSYRKSKPMSQTLGRTDVYWSVQEVTLQGYNVTNGTVEWAGCWLQCFFASRLPFPKESPLTVLDQDSSLVEAGNTSPGLHKLLSWLSELVWMELS